MIVVQDGRPIEGNLARNRITVDELQAAARIEGIPSLDRVRWAVLETSVRLSFIEK
ncbi:MAG: YetF domain-containing protein [Gaiellaceae bacterium]